MNINDLKSLGDLNNHSDIVVNGEAIPVDELTQRTITVYGVQPTNYEEWTFIDVIVQLRNKKEGAGGTAQTTYRYPDLNDIHKFNDHNFPYKIKVIMADAADKKGNVIQEIIFADFASAVELELVPRKANQPKMTTGVTK